MKLPIMATNLLHALRDNWLANDNEAGAKNFGSLLKEALDNESEAVIGPTSPQTEAAATSTASITGEVPKPIDSSQLSAAKEVASALDEAWSHLFWCSPRHFMNTVAYDEKIRTVDLLRSPTMIVRLFYIEAGGSLYDQHATNARELVHVLGGKAGAKIGTIKEWIKALSDDNPFYEFMPTAPQVVQSGETHPLLYVSAWDLKACGGAETRFWFSEVTRGKNYTNDIMEIQNVQDYYNKMATDYEASMFGWGYCMPEAIADALVKHGGLKIEAKVLDLGCGNGLSGQALYNRGVEDIAGVDFSSEMLKQCAKRACYTKLQKADLLEPLPFEDASFDCLLSVAVTTYLKPSVLETWLKVAKPGGIVSFTHKTSVWPDWEKEQERLELELKLWEKVWISDPIPYLPSLKEKGGEEPCTEMAKVYIYRKL